MKAKVFPDPVFAAPRTSRPHREWGREALCISVITLYLAPFNPSLVFLDNGNWPNSEHPAYRENEFPSSFPIGDLGGNGGSERGFDPLSGFPQSIHDLSSSISSTSNSLFCLRRRMFLDLGFLMLELERGTGRQSGGVCGREKEEQGVSSGFMRWAPQAGMGWAGRLLSARPTLAFLKLWAQIGLFCNVEPSLKLWPNHNDQSWFHKIVQKLVNI